MCDDVGVCYWCGVFCCELMCCGGGGEVKGEGGGGGGEATRRVRAIARRGVYR